MTEQLVIKLNKKKFKPILDDFNKNFLKNSAQSYSWLTGFALWYMHKYALEKSSDFDGKTRLQWIIDKRGININEALLIMMGQFTEYIKTKNQ